MVMLLCPQELRQVAERQGDGSEEAYRTPQPPPSGKMAYATNANGEQPGVSNKPNSVDVLKCAHAVAEAAQDLVLWCSHTHDLFDKQPPE